MVGNIGDVPYSPDDDIISESDSLSSFFFFSRVRTYWIDILPAFSKVFEIVIKNFNNLTVGCSNQSWFLKSLWHCSAYSATFEVTPVLCIYEIYRSSGYICYWSLKVSLSWITLNSFMLIIAWRPQRHSSLTFYRRFVEGLVFFKILLFWRMTSSSISHPVGRWALNEAHAKCQL